MITGALPARRAPGPVTVLKAMTSSQSESEPVGSAQPSQIDWQSVLTKHDRWLRTVIFARTGERQTVDEIMQEVSLAAIRQQAPIQDPAKVAPWLYRLAVTYSLLYRRKQGRRRKLIDRYVQRFQPTEEDRRTTDPLGWLLADERSKLVRQALKRLPHRDAEILLLKYTEDWSYRDLARHLGTTESAVESRLHRARCRMRSELESMEIVSTEIS